MRKNMPSNTNEKITKTISDMINIKANSIKNSESYYKRLKSLINQKDIMHLNKHVPNNQSQNMLSKYIQNCKEKCKNLATQ